eukprot:1192037-Prorocentrum_minimum.AAC.2
MAGDEHAVRLAEAHGREVAAVLLQRAQAHHVVRVPHAHGVVRAAAVHVLQGLVVARFHRMRGELNTDLDTHESGRGPLRGAV